MPRGAAMTGRPENPFLPRIHSLMPGLEVQSAVISDEGLMNDVLVVNDELIFRFAKSDESAAALHSECSLLAHIRPYLMQDIPQPLADSEDAMVYRMLPGVPLTRELLATLEKTTIQSLADQIAEFLRRLHSIPVTASLPETSAPVHYEDWVTLRAQVVQSIYPLLLSHQRRALDLFFERMLNDPANFNYEPTIIHADLAPYHLLYEPETRRLSGVLDFGVAGVGDPANDLGCLIQYFGERFVKRMLPVYPTASALLPRARNYARGLELEWVTKGMLSGETSWFTAHLAAARDLEGWE